MNDFAKTVYQELRAIAQRKLADQSPAHTLQATALVNEAWFKLRGHFNMTQRTPAFYITAAEAMRQILIDHARGKKRLKRGGGDKKRQHISDLAEVAELSDNADYAEVLSLNEALTELEKLDPQAASVVKLRFFGGLSVEETAASLELSERTVKRDWQFARAWLAQQLAKVS